MRPRSPSQEHTSFQEHAPYDPRYEIKADVAMVYGIDGDWAARLACWQAAGYIPHVMTGISWGAYQAYVGGLWDGVVRYGDAQQTVGNFKLEHGISQGQDIFYMVPTQPYTAYLSDRQITFNISAPLHTTAVMRILLPQPPREIIAPVGDVQGWEPVSRTLFLSFPAEPQRTRVMISW